MHHTVYVNKLCYKAIILKNHHMRLDQYELFSASVHSDLHDSTQASGGMGWEVEASQAENEPEHLMMGKPNKSLLLLSSYLPKSTDSQPALVVRAALMG